VRILRRKISGTRKVELQRPDAFQPRDVLSRLDVGAGTHLPQSRNALERRLDRHLVELRLDFGMLGERLIQILARHVERFGADEVLRLQLLRAPHAIAVEVELGLDRRELRLDFGRVERNEPRARPDQLPFREMYGADAPFRFRPDHHRLVGEQRSDRAHLLADPAGGDDARLHR
jgi:hypothetical protein